MQIIGTALNATVKEKNNALLMKMHLPANLWLVRAWFHQPVPFLAASAYSLMTVRDAVQPATS